MNIFNYYCVELDLPFLRFEEEMTKYLDWCTIHFGERGEEWDIISLERNREIQYILVFKNENHRSYFLLHWG